MPAAGRRLIRSAPPTCHRDDSCPASPTASGSSASVFPWRSAHVSTGRGNAVPWGEHCAYLQALDTVLTGYLTGPHPVCLLGDFNQRIPRHRQPREVYALMHQCILQRMHLITASAPEDPNAPLIDHIAICNKLQGNILQRVPKCDPDGHSDSDHTGVIASLLKK